MTPGEMLVNLHEYGGDAGSEFNDGDLMGWFGWTVEGDVLKVSFEPSEGDGPGPEQTARWRLVPIEEES